MKKILISFLMLSAFVLVISQNAYADRVRIKGLGLTAASAWMVPSDTAIIALNPAEVNKYPSLLYVDYTGATSAKNGVLFFRPSDKLIVMYATGATAGYSEAWDTNRQATDFGAPVTLAANETFGTDSTLGAAYLNPLALSSNFINVTAGYKVDDNLVLGFRAGYSLVTDYYEDVVKTDLLSKATTTKDFLTHEAYIGAGATINKSIEVGLNIKYLGIGNTFTYEDSDDNELTAEYASNLNYKIDLFARMIIPMSETNTLIPAIGLGHKNSDAETTYKTDNGTSVQDDMTDTYGKGMLTAYIGVSDIIKPNKDVMVYFGTMVNFSSRSLELGSSAKRAGGLDSDFENDWSNSSTSITMPVFIGAEVMFIENWTFRAGVNKTIFSRSSSEELDKQREWEPAGTDDTTNTTSAIAQAGATTFNMGLDWAFGNLKVITCLQTVIIGGAPDSSILNRGPWLITGGTSSISQTFADLAIVYKY